MNSVYLVHQPALSADTCPVSKHARNLAIAAASGGPLGVTNLTSSSKYCSCPRGDTVMIIRAGLSLALAMLCGTLGGMNT